MSSGQKCAEIARKLSTTQLFCRTHSHNEVECFTLYPSLVQTLDVAFLELHVRTTIAKLLSVIVNVSPSNIQLQYSISNNSCIIVKSLCRSDMSCCENPQGSYT